jgi:heme/copper-type cytochrome/quinol oxidase subunit 2
MSNNEDSNYVSVGSWMWMMFVTVIPVLGLIMVFVWAFTGENESRKNYYRAILSWLLVLVVLFVVLFVMIVSVGGGPALQRYLQDHRQHSP